MKRFLVCVAGILCLAIPLGCSRSQTPTNTPTSAPEPTRSTAPTTDAQAAAEMLATTEQKAGLTPYPGARPSAAIPLAVRPDGTVQFAFETSDPMTQVVDHYVKELGLSFNVSTISGNANGRHFTIEFSPSGTGTLVKVHSDPA